MYAARAKTIRNTSSVNVDRGTDGPGVNTDSESLRVVSLELDGLRQRFLSREREFDALCATSASSASENARLKGELQRLEAQNASERKELEQKMGTVIHSKSSLLATQNEKFGKLQIRLQERVTTYQKTCEQQEREITRLRDERSLLERKMSDVGATRTEVKEMQTVMEAWQAQAVGLQRELQHHKDMLRSALATQASAEQEAKKVQAQVGAREEAYDALAARCRAFEAGVVALAPLHGGEVVRQAEVTPATFDALFSNQPHLVPSLGVELTLTRMSKTELLEVITQPEPIDPSEALVRNTTRSTRRLIRDLRTLVDRRDDLDLDRDEIVDLYDDLLQALSRLAKAYDLEPD